MVQATKTMLDGLMLTCIGRHDDYAIQQPNGRYVRAGVPLTYQVLYQHVQGVQSIGTYVIDEEGCCRFAVYDGDGSLGLEDLYGVQLYLASDGVPSYLEQSRRGGHLWVFLAVPTPAPLVRAWLLPYCPANVEFYPKQETASYEAPGSLIRVPFGVHQRSGQRYPFVALNGENGQVLPLISSVVEGLQWLWGVERVTVPQQIINGLVTQQAQPTTPTHTLPPSDAADVTAHALADIRTWCLHYDPVEVIGQYVALDDRGVGCCPFGWHHSDGVDRHASLYVYRPATTHLRCWYCHTWRQGGSLFDFFSYYYGLTARELWFRLQHGARL